MDWNKQSNTINVSIIACVCLFLMTRCLVFSYLWTVVKNFGEGLREAVYFPEEQTDAHGEVRRTSSPQHDEPDA
ncbi:Hypothetical predicted protein [Paramuricea clavata]|uniref:Uncharacterized protein n=1 Tax=Paramuricea clavata TaxID=317549 RepID=A0A6S7IUB6_PARCT|nr:Hypothetical predicted protein [Paramuricea clavata]